MRSKCRCSCVLQFTRWRTVCCVLHRPMSQVIHRLEWYLFLFMLAFHIYFYWKKSKIHQTKLAYINSFNNFIILKHTKFVANVLVPYRNNLLTYIKTTIVSSYISTTIIVCLFNVWEYKHIPSTFIQCMNIIFISSTSDIYFLMSTLKKIYIKSHIKIHVCFLKVT